MSTQHSIYEYDVANYAQYHTDAKQLTHCLNERARVGWDLYWTDGAMYIFRRVR